MRYRHVLYLTLFAVTIQLIQAAADTGKAGVGDPVPTPPQFHGPFYPDVFPRDTDNDLLFINDATTRANGQIVHLRGRVLDLNGDPVPHAVVELWQSDAAGIYLHHDSPQRSDYDQNFQGFGRVLTGPSGEFYFRTVRPATHVENRVRRAPHFHLGVFAGDRTLFTQVYFEGEILNPRDPILNSIPDPEHKAALVVPLVPSADDELGASFDVVLRFRQESD